MSFLYLFDLVDFDKDGNVCETTQSGLAKARSNFLYLISKYNQSILQENNVEIPEFFKHELAAVLKNVEAGGDFQAARRKVVSHCLTQVQSVACESDREMIEELNQMVVVKDKDFLAKFKNATNALQLEYIITNIAGSIMQGVFKQIAQFKEGDNLGKSKIFKDVIKYNNLVNVATKIKAGELAAQERVFG